MVATNPPHVYIASKQNSANDRHIIELCRIGGAASVFDVGDRTGAVMHRVGTTVALMLSSW